MKDWQARAEVDGNAVLLAVGTAGDITALATAEMEKRNINSCRLWRLDDGHWTEQDELLVNVKHDPNSPIQG